MRTIKNYLMLGLMPIMALALLVGCNNSETPDGPNLPDVEKDSVIKLSKTSVSASLAGGSYLLEYTIENPHQGEKISAEAAEDWVNGFNYGITGALQFNVDANPGTESRECLVTVKYRYAEDVVFSVKQGAKVSAGFTLENVSSTYFDYTIDVIPEDKKTPYIMMSAHPDYIVASGFETGEDYYEDDVMYFGWLGQFYGESATEIMQDRAKVGDQRGITVSGAASGVPYTFYCYYIDYETGALLSDVAMFTVTTAKPEYQDVTFDMQHEVDGCQIKATVTPQGGFDGDYYFDVLNSVVVDSYLETHAFLTDVSHMIEYWWSNAVTDMSNDLSYDEIVAMYTSKGNNPDGTPKSYYEFELLANHDYYLFAFAMEGHGLACSTPQVVKITTGDVEMSNNVITPSVSNVTAQTVTINFKTENNDHYVAGWEKASDWATYGNNDAERQEYLLTNLSYELVQGDYSQNVIGLEPETDYVLYAFGSRGGVATTSSIFTCPFKTRKISGGLASIEIVDNGFYMAEDVADILGINADNYSGQMIFPLEYKITGEYSAFFSTVWDWTGRTDIYNDEQYRDNLVWSINEYGSMSPIKSYSVLNNDRYYEIVALVVDQYGDFSDVAKLSVSTSYAGAKTDVSVFEAWWNDKGDVGLSSLVYDEEPKQLFRAKNQGQKVSQMTFEHEQVAMEADEIIARR